MSPPSATARPAFAICEAMLALTCVLLAPLGRYPHPARVAATAAAMRAASA